jgi:ribosomal protein S18 acetylase RimI-like enzyme
MIFEFPETGKGSGPEGCMVTLQKMTEDEFSHYILHLTEGYAQDMSQNMDMPLEAARERSKKQISELLTEGVNTPDHLIYTVCLDGSLEDVGVLWVYTDKAKKEGFIYDIEIKEAYRGKGFGRAALLALEDQLIPLGIEKLGLHVFGDNHAAIHLYESVGYTATNIQMRKRLSVHPDQ